ncbi:hypothetical protein B9Z55_016193 [Caenorhabditis nigoni]|uniref:Uncharacterized protein n=1 Tax=Caenorhabditis nigoni TaxID=1611254 RepID=A0A2G5UDL5_9PELO|nr:hypothetical protein B9Z55_016193 [Caenorhabditis nigoni]
MLIFSLILGLALFQTINAAGLLDIRLKSAYDQKATVILSDDVDPMYLVLPMVLVKNQEVKFEDLFINFNKTYKVTIKLDETESLGLKNSVYRGTITPAHGTSSPKKMNLPLTGILFSFKCEELKVGGFQNVLFSRNWSGENCDCNQGDCSKTETDTNKEVDFDVDYTVDTQRLQTIIAMMKKENEVSNSLEKEDRLLEMVMEASGEQLN